MSAPDAILLLALLLAGPAAGLEPGAARPPATATRAAGDAEADAEPIPPGTPLAGSVKLVLQPSQEEAAIRALLVVQEGRPVTPRALRQTAVRLFRSGRCRDVVVRQRDAAPRPEPGPWVDLTVTCLGHRQVAALEIRLASPSPVGEAAVRTAVALETGASADEADLEAAAARVQALLKRRGHREAEVTVAATDERASAVTVQVTAGPATTLAALELRGAGALEPALRRAMTLKPGATLDLETLGADLTALRRELRRGGHWRALVSAPSERQVAGGVAVEIQVEPGPQVEVRFLGAEAFTPDELRSQLGLVPEQSFDRWAVETAQERLRAFYRAHGYATATVAVEERPAGAVLQIRYRIVEGRRYVLAPLVWKGAEHRTAAALDELLVGLLQDETPAFPALPGEERARLVEVSVPGAPSPRQPPPLLAPGRYLDEVTLSRALEGISDDYRANGWLDAPAPSWTADLDGRKGEAVVTVTLREGRRTHVEAIEFSGQKVVPVAELAQLSKDAALAPGAPLVAEKVAATRAALLNRYRSLSYLYAKVDVKQELDATAALVRLRFEIDEGPQVSIGRILVSGNTTTLEAVIRGALAVREGALYDLGALERSQLALLRLGVFRSVGLRLQDADVAEPVKDLLVEVSERPWQTVIASAGFSLANGPRLGLEWTRPNLLGRALELSANGKVNYPLDKFRPDLAGQAPKNKYEGRGDLGLRVPRLEFVPWAASARTGLGAEKQHRPSYNMKRSALTGAVEMPITTRFGLTLQDQIEVDDIGYNSSTQGAQTQADLAAKRFQEGTTTLNSLSVSATLDQRDNAANPHRGWLAQASAEHFVSMGGEKHDLWLIPGSRWPANAVKLQIGLSGYLPLGRGTVLAAAARAGRIVAVTGSSVTIAPKRFYLGGAGTLRGYSEEAMVPQDLRTALAQLKATCLADVNAAGCGDKDNQTDGWLLAHNGTPASAGGQAFLLGKVEVRQAMPFGLELGLFVDLGNLWYDPKLVRLYELRPSAGVGIRAVTPVGPLVFDFGFNLKPDGNLNERTFAPHFTIGFF